MVACWPHEVAYRIAIRMESPRLPPPRAPGTADRETSDHEPEIAAGEKELGLLLLDPDHVGDRASQARRRSPGKGDGSECH